MSADERIERACEIGVQAGDKLTMSDALRHLALPSMPPAGRIRPGNG